MQQRSHSFLKALGILSLLIASTACGSSEDNSSADSGLSANCDGDPRALDYVQDLTIQGSKGYSVVLASAMPAPPDKGDNSWEIRVLDQDSAVMDNLNFEIRPWMPDHGHGTTIPANISEGDTAGSYVIEPVNLWMPGYWEVTITVSDADNAPVDEVVFPFCVEG